MSSVKISQRKVISRWIMAQKQKPEHIYNRIKRITNEKQDEYRTGELLLTVSQLATNIVSITATICDANLRSPFIQLCY